jgi:hypothetical protein
MTDEFFTRTRGAGALRKLGHDSDTMEPVRALRVASGQLRERGCQLEEEAARAGAGLECLRETQEARAQRFTGRPAAPTGS